MTGQKNKCVSIGGDPLHHETKKEDARELKVVEVGITSPNKLSSITITI
jgi:hypothetical protein